MINSAASNQKHHSSTINHGPIVTPPVPRRGLACRAPMQTLRFSGHKGSSRPVATNSTTIAPILVSAALIAHPVSSSATTTTYILGQHHWLETLLIANRALHRPRRYLCRGVEIVVLLRCGEGSVFIRPCVVREYGHYGHGCAMSIRRAGEEAGR